MKSLINSLDEYLKIRRSLGFTLKDTEKLLNNFISFLTQRNHAYITVKLALECAMLPQNALRSTWGRRLAIIRLFAKYLAAEDPRTEIPSPQLLSQKIKRLQPYIYSDKEIVQLLSAFQELPTRGLRHHTYFYFFGLMVVTGCRVSELIALNREDVDMKNGWITIRDSKCHKSRLLPLHPTTLRQIKKYCKLRDSQFPIPDTQSFFLSDQGTQVSNSGTRKVFIRISKRIGLRGTTDSKGPRIHDIRHTFAVKTMLNWYRDGVDINQKISLLSTYLGHKKPSDTYWYITSMPELLAQAALRFENKIGEYK